MSVPLIIISIYLVLLLQFTDIVPVCGVNFLKALNPLNWRSRRGQKSLATFNDTCVSDFAEYSGLQVIDLIFIVMILWAIITYILCIELRT